jgi:predicted component of type VI protein secretion system
MAAETFQLVVRTGPNPGKTFELTQDDLTIGRDIGNHIVINDPEVSRKHARLITQAGSYVIEDLGSTNGTFVNGQRLMGPHMLRNGETIMLGEKVSLAFEILGLDVDATVVGAASPPAAPPGPRDTYRIPPSAEEAYPPAPPPVVHTEVVSPPPPPPPVYQPSYSGQIPQGPAAPAYASPQPGAPVAEPYEAPPEEGGKTSRAWIYVGCGCLVVMLCCFVVAGLAFDYLNMYCQPPFNLIFNCP